MKIVGMCSLYEPLQFLSNRIRNLNQCDLHDVMVYFADCSCVDTWGKVKSIVESECKFEYKLHHFDTRTTLYYTWKWIINQTIDLSVQYYCNTNVDDIQAPDYHNKMANFLNMNPNIKIVACPWYITNIKGQIWPAQCDNQSGPNIDKTMGHFPMWRADLHREGIIFDERMVAVGDAYFWTEIKKKYGSAAFAIYPEILSYYLNHENNLYYTAKGPHGQNGEAWDRSIGK